MTVNKTFLVARNRNPVLLNPTNMRLGVKPFVKKRLKKRYSLPVQDVLLSVCEFLEIDANFCGHAQRYKIDTVLEEVLIFIRSIRIITFS